MSIYFVQAYAKYPAKAFPSQPVKHGARAAVLRGLLKESYSENTKLKLTLQTHRRALIPQFAPQIAGLASK